MVYKIMLTDVVKSDVKIAISYLARKTDIDHSTKHIKITLLKASKALQTFPNCGHKLELSTGIIDHFFELVVNDYRVIYRLDKPKKHIVISAFIHSKCDITQQIQQRNIQGMKG